MWTVSGFQPRTAEHSLPSWTAAYPFQLVKVFPNSTTCSGFTSPGRDAAGLALHTLLKNWCQTLCFLLTTSLSIWPAKTALHSLWSQAERYFPPIPTQEGLHCCLMQPSAAGICNRTQGCFRLKLRVEFPAQSITWHRYSQLFPASQDEAFDDFSELNKDFFQNLLPEWMITAQLKNILDFLKKAGLFCCLVFATLYSLQRWRNCHWSYNYSWKITDKTGMGLIVLKQWWLPLQNVMFLLPEDLITKKSK